MSGVANNEPHSGYFDPAGLTLLGMIWRWRIFLLVNVVIVMVIAAGVALMLPNIYRAHASILPPQSDSDALSTKAMDLIGGIGPVGFAGTGLGRSSSELLATVLRSRRLADMVVQAEDLQNYYNTSTLPATRRRFDDAFSTTIDADGLVNVYVSDRDPEKAASVANTVVSALDSINHSVALTAASSTRRFVESQLTEVQSQLTAAENELRDFQEQKGTIALEEQLNVLIQNLAVLRVERMKQEMQLALLQDRLPAGHQRLQSIRDRIATIDLQINAAESSNDSAATLTAGNAPQLSLQSLRLIRKVTVYEQIYQFLRQRLEQAKIDERRDLPTFTILDRAVPPDQKWRPLRSFIVLGSGLTAAAILLVLIVWTETLRKHTAPERVGYIGGWRRLRRRENTLS